MPDNRSLFQKLSTAVMEFQARNKRPITKEEWLTFAQNLGMPQDQAGEVYDRGMDLHTKTGKWATETQFDELYASSKLPMAPLPYQVNPMTWDSLSQTAKSMILAAAEKGRTPSGAWTAQDYMGQLDASRPKGTAPRRTSYDFGKPSSAY